MAEELRKVIAMLRNPEFDAKDVDPHLHKRMNRAVEVDRVKSFNIREGRMMEVGISTSGCVNWRTWCVRSWGEEVLDGGRGGMLSSSCMNSVSTAMPPSLCLEYCTLNMKGICLFFLLQVILLVPDVRRHTPDDTRRASRSGHDIAG
jgi:hypothetical protein